MERLGFPATFIPMSTICLVKEIDRKRQEAGSVTWQEVMDIIGPKRLAEVNMECEIQGAA